MWRVHVDGV